MQGTDDEYYLHHDFYREDSKYGCLYVKKQADLYGKESFCEEHPVISFDTLYEERPYEVIAVFRS